MNVYLIQSTDYLKDQAIQNAIVVAENRSIAIEKFSKELRNNPYCRQSYRSTWFSCKKININKPKMLVQYGGDTWQFDEVEYGQERCKIWNKF